MISPQILTQAGILPIKKSPVRFAIGPPDGYTSNSWRIWTTKAGDVYIACRDNFKEAKVSLHASGRWRMGFTTEAITNNPLLVGEGENRAWDIWDRPVEKIPNIVQAFKLVFSSSQLKITPDKRLTKSWKDVIYIEAPPIGKLTVITLFVTNENVRLNHESEPSFWLASLDLNNGCYAQLVAHGEHEGNLPDLISCAVENARLSTKAAGQIPEGAYGYFLGHRDDGVRYMFGAPV